MKPIPADYVVEDNAQEAFPDGPCTINGKIEWFTKDQEGRPILVAQKNGSLVGRLRFTLSNGSDGPPMSMTLGEMPILVHKFCGAEGVEKLPNIPKVTEAGKVSAYMTQVANLIRESSKELKVKVENGWVSNFLELPAGPYEFYVSNLSPVDKETGDPTPKEGQYGPFFFVEFTIEGGTYSGASFNEIVSYAVKMGEDGPEWEKTSRGEYTASAARLSKLMRLSAPDMFEQGVPNKYNLLPYWKSFLGEKNLMSGYRSPDEKGRVKLLFQTLESTNKSAPKESPAKEESQASAEKNSAMVETEDHKARTMLVEALNYYAGEPTVREGTFDLVGVGIEVARKYLSPMKKSKENSNGFLTKGDINLLKYDEIVKIFEHLPEKDSFINGLYSKLAGVGLGFEEETGGGDWLAEEENTPF